MIIELLLLGILGAEGVRLFSLLKKKGKKDYFKNRLMGIDIGTEGIYDTEFSRFKVKELKEKIRTELTAVKSKQSLLQEEIKKQEGVMPEAELAKLKDQDEILEVKVNKLIYGVGRPKLHEDGTVNEEATKEIQKEVDMCIKGMDEQLGFLNEKIDSLQELKVMVKSYTKSEL